MILALGLLNIFFLDDLLSISFFRHLLASIDASHPPHPGGPGNQGPDRCSLEPIPCHSHNDYLQRRPLDDALDNGCISVEADVWFIEGELYVGHTLAELRPSRTLQSLYVEPLLQLLDSHNAGGHLKRNQSRPAPWNGVYECHPDQPLVLLIEFKSSGPEAWPHVMAQLEPLRSRGYLTAYNGSSLTRGPLTVVGTGNCPFDHVLSNDSYRDIFFDAPLDHLSTFSQTASPPPLLSLRHLRKRMKKTQQQHLQALLSSSHESFNPSNSFYASASLSDALGYVWPWQKALTNDQLRQARIQIDAAHRMGLKARYYGVPGWSSERRDRIFGQLLDQGMDMLNADDLPAARRLLTGRGSG